MIKKLFLDFDNTLAHSLYATSKKHADDLIYEYGELFVGAKFHLRGDGWMVTFKRSWTDELLKFSRELYGEDNVYILTTGTVDYIGWCNVVLKLEFDPNTNIFGREDIVRQDIHPKFVDTFNVLVDDLLYYDHSIGDRCKVNFLNKIPPEQFINVEYFSVHQTSTLISDKDYIKELKCRIVEAFESIKTEI